LLGLAAAGLGWRFGRFLAGRFAVRSAERAGGRR
jgi:hypothetical protein